MDNPHKYIEGIGIAGYRSFGASLQRLGPFRKINLLIGQNNSGKSNVLTFLTSQYQPLVNAAATLAFKNRTKPLTIEKINRHLADTVDSLRLSVGYAVGGPRYHVLLDDMTEASAYSDKRMLGERFLKSQTMTRGTAVSWFDFKIEFQSGIIEFDDQLVEELINEKALSEREWMLLWQHMTKHGGGSLESNWIPELLVAFGVRRLTAPEITLIPAVRSVAAGALAADNYSGAGLVERLARLQNPAHHEQHLKLHFEEINVFLRTVVANKTARLEIPFERNEILVHMDGRTLPLSSLGTGIHEVIILAAAATVLREQVLCIEEVELHLHPLLQKKLIRYLADKTSNQYFITTHSAHLLDTPGAAIFHLRHQDGATTVDPVYTAGGKSLVCVDLGYRPSDLLQANCVIWVEGPSDRVYLNHWVRSVAPDLVEGIHYSIMFYGGRLLSHLSAEDPEVTEFISLRRLNRYISILIDSDRASASARLNETKRRVRGEFEPGPGFAWVTAGREIENYVPADVLERAVKKVHPQATRLYKTGRYDHALHYRTARAIVTKSVDKVKVAHEVANEPANLEVLDLRRMVTRLVTFIRGANDFSE